MHNMPKMDELKVSLDVGISKLIHEQCQQKTYHGDIKDHMTLKTRYNAVLDLPLNCDCGIRRHKVKGGFFQVKSQKALKATPLGFHDFGFLAIFDQFIKID